MQSAQTLDTELTVNNNSNIRKAVVASTIGTIIEWYDYGLYAAASGLIINRLFFRSSRTWAAFWRRSPPSPSVLSFVRWGESLSPISAIGSAASPQ
ncbi:hypothetical protein [Sodalis ligni]|uniref:hypothetical protein n=1 Tax=Sodalis ligni TaxID=2697027 RepID=UPI001FB75036|nr:hypothetical protein [Sodalis ligni]